MQELPSNARHLFIGHTGAALMFFALIVPQPVHAAHPSIFFSSGDIPAIRTKATTSHSAIVQPILSLASSLLPLPVPTAPIGADYTNLSLDSRDVMALAFAFVATGDARYLALGRQYLVAFASWPYWGADAKLGDRDLSLGFMLGACAMAYDWLYDSLSTSDRAAVRAALVKHAQEMYEAAMGPYNADWGNWWPQSFGQNHWDNNITALGIAALALDGESDGSAIWLNKAVTEMRKDSFDLANIGDGTWHEGCLYQNSKRYRATNADGSMGGPMISKFVRNVLFVRPSYFVIVDNVADSAAHAYQMRFHFGDSAVIDTGLGWVRASCAGNNVVGGSTTGIPCDLRSMRNAVVIVRVEVNGTTLARSLLRLIE